MSLKEMRDELRALRKDAVKPVSRMRKADIAAELEKLRGRREETAPVASTVSAAKPKAQEAKIKDVKKAKEAEFPVKPAEEPKKKDSGKSSGKKATVVGGGGAAGTKSKMSKDMLRKMIEEMPSDSE